LQTLAGAFKAALVERGLSANAAILAAHAGVTGFHVAFARWVQQDDPTTDGRVAGRAAVGDRRLGPAAADPAADQEADD
jgi:hypothetical protein